MAIASRKVATVCGPSNSAVRSNGSRSSISRVIPLYTKAIFTATSLGCALMIACRTSYQGIKPLLAEYIHQFFAKTLIDIRRSCNGLREATLLRIIFRLLGKVTCFFCMHCQQKLSSIERDQREWPEPTVHRLDIQIGKACLHRI